MFDPAAMATADGPMGPAPVQAPSTAAQMLAEMLGEEEMRYQRVQEIASLAAQALAEFVEPGLVTADGPMGPEPMPMEDDMGGEEMMEPEEEMDPEYGVM